ncbi:unnamed protein product, partial [Symbiodinium microadriaticum]
VNGRNGRNGASKSNGEKSGAQLFDELRSVDSSIAKEDYYDASTNTWDVQGMQEDLLLMGQQEKQDPEGIFKELQRFAPGALREDYFSEATQDWDLEGLHEDLRISRAQHPVFPS